MTSLLNPLKLCKESYTTYVDQAEDILVFIAIDGIMIGVADMI